MPPAQRPAARPGRRTPARLPLRGPEARRVDRAALSRASSKCSTAAWKRCPPNSGPAAASNPIGATRLAGAFLATFHDAELPETLRPLLFRQYEHELSRVLGDLYGRINTLLAAAGYGLKPAPASPANAAVEGTQRPPPPVDAHRNRRRRRDGTLRRTARHAARLARRRRPPPAPAPVKSRAGRSGARAANCARPKSSASPRCCNAMDPNPMRARSPAPAAWPMRSANNSPKARAASASTPTRPSSAHRRTMRSTWSACCSNRCSRPTRCSTARAACMRAWCCRT